MLLQIGIQIFLPTIFIIMLLRARYTSKLRWFTETIALGLAIIFVFITGRWDITSYYIRILLLPLFAFAAFIASRRIMPEEASLPTWEHFKMNALNIVLIVIFGWLSISAWLGYFYPGEAVNLSYPLRDGVYYIGGGGTSRWINNHHAFPPQDYALDILRLNKLGIPGSIQNKSNLEDYEIFGNPIYSPCKGTVIITVDGHKDQVPPHTDLINLAGNYVLIECQGVEILLAHMKEGSILVSQGDLVQVGAKIGAVGNSGNTSQPHLHIHAEKNGANGVILSGQGVPITFENRFLVRNDLFTGNRQGSK